MLSYKKYSRHESGKEVGRRDEIGVHSQFKMDENDDDLVGNRDGGEEGLQHGRSEHLPHSPVTSRSSTTTFFLYQFWRLWTRHEVVME